VTKKIKNKKKLKKKLEQKTKSKKERESFRDTVIQALKYQNILKNKQRPYFYKMKLKRFLLRYYPPGIILEYMRSNGEME